MAALQPFHDEKRKRSRGKRTKNGSRRRTLAPAETGKKGKKKPNRKKKKKNLSAPEGGGRKKKRKRRAARLKKGKGDAPLNRACRQQSPVADGRI